MDKSRQTPSARRIVGMVVGIVIIGLGIALFKQSHLGNDSISALNMRLAEMLGISLGVQNLCTNILFFAVQFWFGRKYIGLGTFVNGIGVGFIITAFYEPIAAYFGPAEAAGLPVQLLWVALAVPVTALHALPVLRVPRFYRRPVCAHLLAAGRPCGHRNAHLRILPWAFHPVLQWPCLRTAAAV